MAFFPKMRCDACHGAGPAPEWASDASTITAIRLERSAGGMSFVEKDIVIRDRLSAKRSIRVPIEAPPEGIGSFKARESSEAYGTVSEDQWNALTRVVAESGLFRFEGEAVTTWGTHCETAFVFVSRRDRPDCVLGSMVLLDDDEHPTFKAVLNAIDRLESAATWIPDAN